jgi:hypothetical protein
MKLKLQTNLNQQQMEKHNKKIGYFLGGGLLLLSVRSTLVINDLLTALVLVILGTSVLYYNETRK